MSLSIKDDDSYCYEILVFGLLASLSISEELVDVFGE